MRTRLAAVKQAAGSMLSIFGGLVGIMVTGVIDYLTGFEIRLFPLYFLPIAFVAWRVTRSAAVVLAFVSAATWLVANWMAGREYSSAFIWGINFASQFVAFGVVGYLVAELRLRLVLEQSIGRHDPLTGLPNVRAFYERGALLLAVGRRSGRPVTLAYLDLDDFKKINDATGHQEGDRALKETAEVLKAQLRTSDVAARLGGDEFAILLPDTGPDAARASLERVRSELAECMRRNGWPVTVSVGAIVYVQAPAKLAEAMQEADALMYHAKRSGKDRVHVEVVELDPRPEWRAPLQSPTESAAATAAGASRRRTSQGRG